MYSFDIPYCITDLVPTIWRFLPAVDPLVDEFHSRDLDSLVSQREFDAVNEFRNWKNAQFHIMRDHKMHSAPILGNTRMYPLSRYFRCAHAQNCFGVILGMQRNTEGWF